MQANPADNIAPAVGHDGSIACVECDLLVRVPRLSATQRSRCPRCGHVLCYGNLDRARHALPYGICAAILLPVSLLFPFLSFERAGVANEMTLLQTAWTLFADGSVVLAGLVFGFIIALPACVVSAVVLVSASMYSGHGLPLLRPAARFVFAVNTWSMVEVFIIGVLVSLIKIAEMATVEMGVSLWTYVAFATFTVAALAAC